MEDRIILNYEVHLIQLLNSKPVKNNASFNIGTFMF